MWDECASPETLGFRQSRPQCGHRYLPALRTLPGLPKLGPRPGDRMGRAHDVHREPGSPPASLFRVGPGPFRLQQGLRTKGRLPRPDCLSGRTRLEPSREALCGTAGWAGPSGTRWGPSPAPERQDSGPRVSGRCLPTGAPGGRKQVPAGPWQASRTGSSGTSIPHHLGGWGAGKPVSNNRTLLWVSLFSHCTVHTCLPTLGISSPLLKPQQSSLKKNALTLL